MPYYALFLEGEMQWVIRYYELYTQGGITIEFKQLTKPPVDKLASPAVPATCQLLPSTIR